MGWDFKIGATKAEIVSDCVSGGYSDEVLAYKLIGNELWVVVHFLNSGLKVINLYLLDKYKGNWGYKAMSESMGPYYYKCPLRFLDMAPVANQKWRDGVVAYHQGKNRTAL